LDGSGRMGGAREKNRSVNSSPDARKKKTETQRADRWTLMRNRTGPKNLADVATLIAHGVPLESYIEICGPKSLYRVVVMDKGFDVSIYLCSNPSQSMKAGLPG